MLYYNHKEHRPHPAQREAEQKPARNSDSKGSREPEPCIKPIGACTPPNKNRLYTQAIADMAQRQAGSETHGTTKAPPIQAGQNKNKKLCKKELTY